MDFASVLHQVHCLFKNKIGTVAYGTQAQDGWFLERFAIVFA
jgi:hypothetical protein